MNWLGQTFQRDACRFVPVPLESLVPASPSVAHLDDLGKRIGGRVWTSWPSSAGALASLDCCDLLAQATCPPAFFRCFPLETPSLSLVFDRQQSDEMPPPERPAARRSGATVGTPRTGVCSRTFTNGTRAFSASSAHQRPTHV
jgi:hypothetical protein